MSICVRCLLQFAHCAPLVTSRHRQPLVLACHWLPARKSAWSPRDMCRAAYTLRGNLTLGDFLHHLTICRSLLHYPVFRTVASVLLLLALLQPLQRPRRRDSAARRCHHYGTPRARPYMGQRCTTRSMPRASSPRSDTTTYAAHMPPTCTRKRAYPHGQDCRRRAIAVPAGDPLLCAGYPPFAGFSSWPSLFRRRD